jgi:integrase
MASKWQKTQYPGVRYREHPQRIHNSKPDRYFTIYYKHNGKLHEEALGWSSDGWNAKKASIELGKLKQAQTLGDGPVTLAEKRKASEETRAAEVAQKEKEDREALSFGQFFTDTYFPQAKTNKSERSYKREEQLFNLWISTVIGDLALKDISPLHLEQIKANMSKNDRSARSVRYALAVVRQVFNMARYLSLYEGQPPTQNVKFPQEDNRRLRFLSHDEADKLLATIKSKSRQLYELSLLSLKTGARADELFKLTWGDIDFERRTLTLWDTKNTRTRIAYLTEDTKAMLQSKTYGKKTDLVFPGRNGEKIEQISVTFNRTVKELKLNEGVKDRRMKVVFHTLRHTYASWLVENGESLYTVKELMGHSTLTMTERYAHLSNDTLQRAVKRLEEQSMPEKP